MPQKQVATRPVCRVIFLAIRTESGIYKLNIDLCFMPLAADQAAISTIKYTSIIMVKTEPSEVPIPISDKLNTHQDS